LQLSGQWSLKILSHPKSCPESTLIKSLLANIFSFLRQVVAHEERSFEQLDADDGEDELKEQVDDHDDQDVLDGVNNTVEHSLSTQTSHIVAVNLTTDEEDKTNTEAVRRSIRHI